MSSDLASRAVKMFLLVLKYIGQGGTDLTEAERTQLVLKLYKHTLRRLELRDELFAQLLKQLRNNPHRCISVFSGCFVAWFYLFHVVEDAADVLKGWRCERG
jgi:hypothetical protein